MKTMYLNSDTAKAWYNDEIRFIKNDKSGVALPSKITKSFVIDYCEKNHVSEFVVVTHRNVYYHKKMLMGMYNADWKRETLYGIRPAKTGLLQSKIFCLAD